MSKIRLVTLSRSPLSDDLFEIDKDYPLSSRTEALFFHCTGNKIALTREEINNLDYVFEDHSLVVEIIGEIQNS